MSKGRTSISIDGKKLRTEFDIRNLKLSDASEKCGFEVSYFSKACRDNRISQPAINLLSTYYHIQYDDYKIVDDEKVDAAPVNRLTLDDEVSNALYKIIYSAVYEAVKKAWAE